MSQIAILVVVSMAAAGAQPADSQWFSAWTAALAFILTTSMSGDSVRMIVRPTISGPSLRVRLENTFVQAPGVFSAVYIGQVQSGAALVPGSNAQLTFSGSPA